MLHNFTLNLLSWYDQHKRDLPWRMDNPNPYHVWLSEIMLQQTTVPAVKSYFIKFLDHYPTVHDLAQASEDDVMADWAGLGYYSRARNLHKAAKVISSQLSFWRRPESPSTKTGIADQVGNDNAQWVNIDWLALPGVGHYTAAAINTIAFNKPDVVVDGNIERIMARVYRLETPLPKAKPELYNLATPYFMDHHHGRSGDLAQAFMDLGSSICTPKNLKCDICPINEFCLAKSDEYPKRIQKSKKPERSATCFWIENEKGEVLFEKRPPNGLLGGTIGLPCTDLTTGEMPLNLLLRHPSIMSSFSGLPRESMIDTRNKSEYDDVVIGDVLHKGAGRNQSRNSKGVADMDPDLHRDSNTLGEVRHIFTHFALSMTIQKAQIIDYDKTRYFWQKTDEATGLSSLFKKVLLGNVKQS